MASALRALFYRRDLKSVGQKIKGKTMNYKLLQYFHFEFENCAGFSILPFKIRGLAGQGDLPYAKPDGKSALQSSLKCPHE